MIFNQLLGEWIFGHWFLMTWNDPHSTLLWARIPMLLLTLLLGLVIYTYGSQLGGAWGGLLCLTAYATMPVFLAFGPLVLTDIGLTSQTPQTLKAKQVINREYWTLLWRCILSGRLLLRRSFGRPR